MFCVTLSYRQAVTNSDCDYSEANLPQRVCNLSKHNSSASALMSKFWVVTSQSFQTINLLMQKKKMRLSTAVRKGHKAIYFQISEHKDKYCTSHFCDLCIDETCLSLLDVVTKCDVPNHDSFRYFQLCHFFQELTAHNFKNSTFIQKVDPKS